MDEEQQYESVKAALLDYVQAMFAEMEQDMARSHQEKYALLEDALANATDTDELRVAFEQWYNDHVGEIEFEHESDDMWSQAVAAVLE